MERVSSASRHEAMGARNARGGDGNHSEGSSSGGRHRAVDGNDAAALAAAVAAEGDNNDFIKLDKRSSSSSTSNRRRMTRNHASFVFGLCLIVVQCIVQVGNAVLTQFMFEQLEVESPVLMTYIGMSMLAFLLPFEWWRDRQKQRRREQRKQQIQAGGGGEQEEEDNDNYFQTDGVCKIDDFLDPAPSFDSLEDDMNRLKNIPLESSFHGYPATFLDIAQRRKNDLLQDHVKPWNNRKHIMAALLLQPAMFLADWLLNAIGSEHEASMSQKT
jgi:hypothetical protein